MNLSEHVTLERAIFNETAIRLGIDNYPNFDHIEAMQIVAENIIEPCLKVCPSLQISSFFLCEKLNDIMGGNPISQNCKGEAVNFITNHFNSELFHWIKSNLEFDQLVWEYGNANFPDWVGVSFVRYRVNKKHILRSYKDATGTRLMPFDL